MNSVKHLWETLSFRSKITSLLLPALIPVLLISYIGYSIHQQSIIQKSISTVELITSQSNDEINTFLKAQMDIFKSWTFEDEYGLSLEIDALNKLDKQLQNMVDSAPAFPLIILIEPNGKILKAVSRTELEVNSRKFEGQTLKKLPIKNDTSSVLLTDSNVYQELIKTKYTLLFSFPTRDLLGNINGYFLTFLDWKLLQSRLMGIKQTLNNVGVEANAISIINMNQEQLISSTTPNFRLSTTTKEWLRTKKKQQQSSLLLHDNKPYYVSSASINNLNHHLNNNDSQTLLSLVINIPQYNLLSKKTRAELDRLFYLSLLICLCGAGLLLIVFQIMANNISNPIKEMVQVTKLISDGDLQIKLKATSKDELGELSDSFNKMVESLQEEQDKNQLQNWLQKGQTELNDLMIGDLDLTTLCQNILTFLAQKNHSQVGIFYLANEELQLEAISGYATSITHLAPLSPGEGQVGQAAKNNQMITLQQTANSQLKTKSGLSETTPEHIVIMPWSYDDKIQGVIELGSSKPFQNRYYELFKRIQENIAIAINSAQMRQQKQLLVRETSILNEQLQEQQEELQQTNEELEEQRDELIASEVRLQNQQEELQQINEELEERSEALLKEQAEVKNRNIELQNTHQVLEDKAQELEVASRYKSEFLANMSHELRTPLNSLLLLAKILAENKKQNLTEKQIEYAKTIANSGTELLHLINDILDLSKIEAGKMTLNVDTTDLRKLISVQEFRYRPVAESKGLNFFVDIDEQLPEKIKSDEQRINQILNNLFSNALKFTSSGSIQLKVSRPERGMDLSSTQLLPETSIALSVIDTGIGIPKEKFNLIFEAFQQADGTTVRQYGGTGLGLSISLKLAKLLGGKIHISSDPSRGSTFTLIIPEVSSDNHAQAISEETNLIPPPSNPQSDLPIVQNDEIKPAPIEIKKDPSLPDDRRELEEGELSILIIEDDKTFARLLLEHIQQKGYKVLLAEDGEAGIYLADLYCPNAIILDIGLPRMDGQLVLNRLKDNQNTAHIPVHIISGRDKTEVILSKEVTGYTQKPLDSSDIEDILEIIEPQLNRATLFLHHIENKFPEKLKSTTPLLHNKEEIFQEKNILIVDDDIRNIFALGSLLEEKGITVVEAKNGVEALDKLNPSLDLILMDIMMPQMDGYETMAKIREQSAYQSIPIIAITAKAMKGDRMKCIEAGANDYLTKPVDANKLFSMLRVWLYQ